jgi:endonuclease/exonuclease/phosphatase family metal-dependent hydrolase
MCNLGECGRPRRIAALAALLMGALSLGCSATAAAEPVELRVMSFNVRYSQVGHSEDARENNWSDPQHPRRERAIRVIREANPDLLGVQEARELQVKDFQDALPGFEFYGIGRDDGKSAGEFSGNFYRKDRFTRKDAGSFWLSATPEKPGTSFYTAPNAVPRIASWVKLADAKSNREIVLLNMHWDHIDVPAREKSAELVRSRLATIANGVPTIVTGDLNSTEDTRAYTTLIGEGATGRKFADSYRELHRQRLPDEATFNNWKGTLKGSRIDFILHSAEFTPTAAEIVRTNYDGRWPSDHYPVTSTLQLRPKQE